MHRDDAIRRTSGCGVLYTAVWLLGIATFQAFECDAQESSLPLSKPPSAVKPKPRPSPNPPSEVESAKKNNPPQVEPPPFNTQTQAAQATQPATGALPNFNLQPSISTAAVSQRGFAPGFFGDFFNATGSSFVVPSTPIPTSAGATPFAVNLGASDDRMTPIVDYFRQITPSNGPFPFVSTSDNTVFVGHAADIQNNSLVLNTIPNATSVGPGGGPIYFAQGYTQVATSPIFQGQATGPIGLTAAVPTTTAGFQQIIAVGAGAYIDGSQVGDLHHESTLNNSPAVLPLVTPGFGLPLINNPTPNLPLFILTLPGALNVYSPSAAAGGIQKLVDNSSPIPRDRVFLNYNYFHNTSIEIDGRSLSINRLTPGFEKTFANQRLSIEMRFPFATQVTNNDLSPGYGSSSSILFGNQTTYFKALLYTNPQFSLASGLGVQLPTAPDNSYSVNGYYYTYATNTLATTSPMEIVHIKNQAVNLLPYVGAVYTPNDRFFAQSVAQFDFCANGNSVSNAAIYPLMSTSTLDIHAQSTGLRNAGVLNDTNFMYLSANMGYWAYQVKNPYERGVTGFAPTVELHYNQSLQTQDVVAGYYGNTANALSNTSAVNGVVGANTVFGHNKHLSIAYVAPFTTGVNRFFDGELRVMFNYYFGAPRLNPRFANVPSQ